MTKHLKYYSALIVLATTLSCNGQQKTTPEKTNATTAEENIVITEDHDPYFRETKTDSSKYGPSNITRNILEDKEGNIWLSTWEGILKYDGKTFTNYTNTENLSRFHVFTGIEDSAGNLWFGTIGAGIYRYDGKTFTNFTAKDGLADNSIGCFMEDENGVLWIGTMNGISSYNGASFTNYTLEGDQTNNDINALVKAPDGKLWIGTRGKAHVYDGNVFTQLTTPGGVTFNNVRIIIKDDTGSMWFGGNDGFWTYNGKSFVVYNKKFTGAIVQDSKGNIWTSSASDGNSRVWTITNYDKEAQLNMGRNAVEVKQEENMFFGITEDTKGGIWIGHLRGVYRFDGLLFNDFNLPQIRQ